MSRLVVALMLMLALAACAGTEEADDLSAGDRPSDASVAASTPVAPSVVGSPTDEPTTRKPEDEAARPGTVVVTGNSAYGPMLFDRTGQAIYLFDKERSSTPQCYGECAEAWPPVLTAGPPQAGEGADASLLGTVRRRDGATQVTYDGQPLYFYAHEGKNQVLCHDIREFGGLWLVVTPEGPPAPSSA